MKLLFHRYDKITSKRQYITSILLFYSLDKVVRYVRAELSAAGRAVHGPSCPRAELSGYPTV